MKLWMKRKKKSKLKGNNKGFSLVELVVAIALFAIIVTPVMNTFITSARVNRNSRKLMIATDVAQNIIEGYSEKTYETIGDCIKTATGTSTLVGKNAFTTINSGVYNVSSNWVNLSGETSITDKFTEITLDGVKYVRMDGTVSQSNLTDMIASDVTTMSMNRIVENAVINKMGAVGSVSDQNVYVCMMDVTKADPSGAQVATGEGIIYMVYTNIAADTGYKFNAVVSVIPQPSKSIASTYGITDYNFMSYNIKVTMYDAEDAADPSKEYFGSPVVTVLGGVASK